MASILVSPAEDFFVLNSCIKLHDHKIFYKKGNYVEERISLGTGVSGNVSLQEFLINIILDT